ncbi:TadE/TadG family type IV pilus assembly protein [Vibrio nigripulchritudo]|uniref:TadE/TadG family type IV pilus assembly protein n=1 Tax=Vibrio nigripulchritudo TaxID=28173 RepID=UPI0024934D47|nr:TadE family protein [Vibrio nigripulchritudo]BDU36997.1 pilus assembly protein TadE [Vibrio nigripulchritudo]BDU42707.1 pilus assembly protein TadE [Vibrio nigripulchritudo]
MKPSVFKGNLSKQRGVVAIEAAIGFPILILMILTWIELCLMAFAMAISDHAITRAVADTKKLGRADSIATINYDRAIRSAIRHSGGIIIPAVVEEGSIESNIYYIESYRALVRCSNSAQDFRNCSGVSNEPQNKALALYEVAFTYSPLFNFLLPNIEMRREVMAIQEYERCTFKLGGQPCA